MHSRSQGVAMHAHHHHDHDHGHAHHPHGDGLLWGVGLTLTFALLEGAAGWWAQSLAPLAAGTVIYFTGWMPIDPLLSLLICALILFSGLRLLREALHVIMEGVPPYLELREVGRAMAAVTGVNSVHDLHIWTLSSGNVVLSAHVVIPSLNQWDDVLLAMRALLRERYGIEHVTLQPESKPAGVRVPAPSA